MKPERIEILGVPLDCVDLANARSVVEWIVQGKRQETILAINSEKILRARENSILLDALRGAGLLIPDGIGAVLAAWILHRSKIARVPGVDLMPVICDVARNKGLGVFLFGARPEVNQSATDTLAGQFPGLRIVGNHDGYVGSDELPGLIDEINKSGADILFVALGSPNQELWIHQHRASLDVKLIQGVGGSFDVLSGYVTRAPALFRNTHTEWLYRVITQPSKLPRGWLCIKFGLSVLRTRLGWS